MHEKFKVSNFKMEFFSSAWQQWLSLSYIFQTRLLDKHFIKCFQITPPYNKGLIWLTQQLIEKIKDINVSVP